MVGEWPACFATSRRLRRSARSNEFYADDDALQTSAGPASRILFA
jgi:hypothetical protein